MSVSILSGFESLSFQEKELNELTEMLKSDSPDIIIDQEYLDLIRKISGGRPKERFFNLNGKNFMIDEFLHFGDPNSTKDNDLKFLNINATWSALEDRLPAGVFPFASDPGGNYFCFDHRLPGTPSVAFWNHELSKRGDPTISPIADNFSAFISGLSSKPAV